MVCVNVFYITRSVVRWSNGQVVPGLRVRGFFPRGFDPRTRNEYSYGMLYVSQPHEGDPNSAVLSLKYGGLLIKSAAS